MESEIVFNSKYNNLFKNNLFESKKVKYKNQTFYNIQDILLSIHCNNDTIEIINYLKDFNIDNDIEQLEERISGINLSNNETYYSRQVYINKTVLLKLINSINK